MIRSVDVDRIIDLRWRILRKGLPRQTAIFEGDDEPTTHHFAAMIGDRVVGCATVLFRPRESQAAWQVRGMAVEQQFQRRGIGRKLLEAIEKFVRQRGRRCLLWCNARISAVEFYRKNGWRTVGKEFFIPHAGTHYLMVKMI